MAYTVGVVGASGYGGGELLRLLAGHPAIEVGAVAAHSNAGEPIRAVFPNLDTDGVFDGIDVDRLGELDLVFLATPHVASVDLGGALVGAGVAVVDLSGAFRLTAAEFSEWYGHEHHRPDLTPGGERPAIYGLTEFTREQVASARLVANPGCYPTAALLGLLPLAGLLEPGSVIVDAKSGTSGAGRGIADHLHHPHVHGDVVAYGTPGHRHTPEIERWLTSFGGNDLGAISFTPHLLPVARGLLATCYGTAKGSVSDVDLETALRDRYADEPFVRVLATGTFPHIAAVAGSNGCQVSATVDARTGRITITSAIDNLGKGAAGQALQNANLMLGLDETLGLSAVGTYP